MAKVERVFSLTKLSFGSMTKYRRKRVFNPSE